MLQKFSNLKSNAANLFLVQFPTFWCILELIEPIFLGGGAAQLVSQLGAWEAHQLRVGGIVRAAGPDPFGNGMPLPAYH